VCFIGVPGKKSGKKGTSLKTCRKGGIRLGGTAGSRGNERPKFYHSMRPDRRIRVVAQGKADTKNKELPKQGKEKERKSDRVDSKKKVERELHAKRKERDKKMRVGRL